PPPDIDLHPFHWELEFPEVFDRSNPGFDAIVGNPPFAGKNTIASALPTYTTDWLLQTHSESHGNADLVAHFLRRAFLLLRSTGCLGMIATNTISEGDTRTTGLRWIRKHGGNIYDCRRRVRWPGEAAVIVSTLCIRKDAFHSPALLNNREVDLISAFLVHKGGDDNPHQLPSNTGLSFQGPVVLGMGFTFEDNNPDANPLSKMKEIIEKDSKNAQIIKPYIGGDELLTDPQQSHRRYVIDFEERSENDAQQWPDLYQLVKERVLPGRMKQKDNPDGRRRKKFWWLWGRYTPALFNAIKPLQRILMHSFPSKHLVFAFIPSSTVIAAPHAAFALPEHSSFCALQNRCHEIWARAFGSTQEDRLRYTISDCFETFPFPTSWRTDPTLDTAGEAYYTHRAALMIRNDEGLTTTYNRFHDPNETSPDILRLREIHDAMDRTVLDAYGWTDIQPRCEFLLDYEEEDDDETSSRRRKPWRYRWPDEIQEEVLARLLDLNQKRAEEERLADLTADGGKTKGGKKATKAAKAGKAMGAKKAAKKTPSPARTQSHPSDDDDGWKTTKKKRSKKKPASANLELLPRDEE
ncbi:Eco57I restriction-modification methylase domain-containing protein, partial [Paraliomyxa miuraensis]|uniref:Eco57I restriction-modification methylase domain-containing protein n=1 Tax=Paraliomyxa miuraensis TaxID=376150 RepID=UPI002B1CDF71